MRILHVIGGLPQAAGTSVFCGELANELVKDGKNSVTVAVLNPQSPDCFPLDPRIRLASIEAILHSEVSSPSRYDVLHIHALWTPVFHAVSCWARRIEIPVVWSPHGMLTPWALNNHRLKKHLVWWLYQRRDLQRARVLHATAESEVEDIRRLGLRNPVVLAPLGVRLDPYKRESIHKCHGGRKTLLFVSRVQRKKGLVNLVQAWAELKKISPMVQEEWKVRIVGPDQEGHSAELRSECTRLGISWRDSECQMGKDPDDVEFEFVGPLYGSDLAREYAVADLFVLPTFSENFGSVVIEALSYCVPVICTKGAPWAELEGNAPSSGSKVSPTTTVRTDDSRCGWWIEIGVTPLVAALKEAMSLTTDARRLLGENGRRLVERKYTWRAVSEVLMSVYAEVVKKNSISICQDSDK